MNNQIFEHIEFLLTRYDCVIVPDFGGFIMNITSSDRVNNHEISPPIYSIIFNQDITHNDGLIASSIQSAKKISYSAANNLIKDFVRDLKYALQHENAIEFRNMGTLSKDIDGNIVFKSNKNFNHPFSFGLTPVSLQLIDSIGQSDIVEKRRYQIIKRVGTAAAIVAGLFLFAVPSIKVDETSQEVQKANFLDVFSKSLISSNTSSKIYPNNKAENININNDISATSTPPIEKPVRSYYIIIGGEETKQNADKLLSKFQLQDFPDAAIVKGDRYRIYIASFFDKQEAERFLDIFRLENPQYATAWLYSQKNIY